MLARALRLHAAGDADGAIAAYRATLLSGAAHETIAAYSNLGSLLVAEGSFAEGLEMGAASARLAPGSPDVLFNLANAHMQLKRDEEAASTFSRVIRVDSTHAPAFNNLAVLAQRRQRPAEALAHFRAALRCGPARLALVGGAAQVYGNLAAAGLPLLSASEAVAMQLAAVRLSPEDASMRALLAERLSDAGLPGAEAAWRATLRLAPRDDRAHNSLGALLQALPGRWREAAASYEAAMRSNPAAGEAYHNLGTVRQRAGEREAALALYEAALPLLPAVPNVYVSLASLSPPSRARELHAVAVRLQPGDAEAYTRLALVRAPPPLGLSPPPPPPFVRAAIRASTLASRLAPAQSAPRAVAAPLRLQTAAAALWRAAEDAARAATLAPFDAAAHNLAALLQRATRRPEAAARSFACGLAAAAAAAAAGPAPIREEGAGASVDWRRASEELLALGHTVVDGAAGAAVADALGAELRTLLPLMRAGRVGDGVADGAVRADWRWQHTPADVSVIDGRAPHMRALHALFERVPLALNNNARHPAAWALVKGEDLQLACYTPGGFYRRHADAEHAWRRTLTAIYYVNRDWSESHGGQLRLHLRSGRQRDVAPVADRLVLFLSSLPHEVLAVAETTAGAKEPPPRCAVTQWFNDLAPPLLVSEGGRER